MNERFDDLIEGINEGSFEVFEQIYVRYYGFVIKLLVHFGVPESALEDLSQDNQSEAKVSIRSSVASLPSADGGELSDRLRQKKQSGYRIFG